ncbi:MAG: ATP-grasp domain-containing protein [Paludibacteraceae bacterium]|nr:ATP-grasp domain-containing protein [Paludibacteraceae bacterium]MCK9615900.1 ATP-grasp domain-containing protein [Candidatus Omnitrophota bacterium]
MHKWCAITGTPFRLSKDGRGFDINKNLFIGTTDFIESVLGLHFEPDYYPPWASVLVSRRIKKTIRVPGRECFVKPADKYKTFTGFVKEKGKLIKECLADEYWISDIVSFQQEWRYYVAKGNILETGWYQGEDEEEPAPKLEIDIPQDVYGALDIGRLSNGNLELVEFHHPYSIGWYGRNDNAYAEFLIKGWENLLTLLTD